MSRRLPTFDDEYDCQSCGACCTTNWEENHYVLLNEEDILRLTDNRASLIVYPDGKNGRAALRTKINDYSEIVCAALDGCAGKRVSCSIYDDRPRACRRFARGGSACDYARREMLGISDR